MPRSILPYWVKYAASHWRACLTTVSNSNPEEYKNKSIHSGTIAWDYIPLWILGEFPIVLCTYFRSIDWGLDIYFCIKWDKARIEMRQDTVNHNIYQVERTCGSAYIAGITDAATSDGDACTIRVFLLGLDLKHNHWVEIFLSSVTRDIFKSNYAEIVCAINVVVLE